MKKPVGIFLLLMAALFLLVLSAVIALPFIIDPNDFKPEIVALVKEKTGRDLDMPGGIKLSLFPWLGVSTEKVILKNNQEFQDRPFITIEQSDIEVKLLPLLFAKNIQVSHIILKGLNLNLIKNKQGVSNWQDLMTLQKKETEATAEAGKTPETNEAEMPAKSFSALAIGEIAVEQARIDWDNQKTGEHIELNELRLVTDKFTFDQAVGIDLSFTMAMMGSKLIDSVKLTSELTLTDTFDHFKLTNLVMNLLRKGEARNEKSLTAVLTAADIAFDKADESLRMAGIKINSGELTISAEISGDNMIEKPILHGPVTVAPFDPAKLLRQLNFSVPAMQDTKALRQSAIHFDLLATAESMMIQNLVGRLDDTRINGSAAIKDFAQPLINFNLNLDTIDADRYMSPKMKTDKVITSPAAALAAGVSKLPVDTLRKLNVDGELALNKLKINGLTMQDIHLSLSGKNGMLTTKQSIKQFYQGSYQGNLSLDLRNDQSALSVNENLNGIRIEPLLKDYKGKARISGVVNVSAGLQGQGRNSKALQSSLHGQVNFLLTNGAIKGFNLQKIIDSGKALMKESAPATGGESDQTVFSEISGTAKLSDGVVQNNDLVARSSKFRVAGNGSVNLNSESWDYRLVTRLIKNQATPTEPEQFHSTPVIVKIGGTFDKPIYTLDIASLLTDKNKAKIDKLLDKKKEKIDKLMEKLDKKLGPGASDLLKNIF